MNDELEQRLRFCSNLPSLPAVALKMVEMAHDPDVDLKDVVNVLSMDPALVTRLFRAANSPLYGINRKITNLRQVLNLLGLQGTLALALGFSLVATGPDVRDMPLNTEHFWRRSLLAATACRILGERLSMKNLEELFLAGLLHGIGILALSIMMPVPYKALLQEATEPSSNPGEAVLNYGHLAELERERLGDDHAAVGSWLMRRWHLPDYLCTATAGCLEPDSAQAPEAYRALIQCVALAVRIADIWVRPGYWQNSQDVADLAQRWFGLEADHYVSILEAVGAKFPEIAALFQIKSLDTPQIAGILDQAREVMAIRTAAQRWPERNSGSVLPAARPALALPSQLSSISVTSPRLERFQREPATRPATAYSFDALTGLFKRPRLHERLQQELATARQQSWPLSVALLDLDHCGQINEACGRGVGDQVLMVLGRLLGSHIQHQDVVARYGGDEFALLLPASGALAAARLIRQLMMRIHEWEPALPGGQSLRVTISAGLATYPDIDLAGDESGEWLLAAAEQALQQAKATGGHQLALYKA